jgi:hypothetical protein
MLQQLKLISNYSSIHLSMYAAKVRGGDGGKVALSLPGTYPTTYTPKVGLS